ncbi:MAG: DEAD/DEAH box helicase, partial [Selenomonadaceae bacterium]|nr:DEAD/DEAH box helicase [Selenomonadaceae bacterium]
DPFTGTGTFITRLLQSGIIKQKDLIRKYTRELHANEIVLLAYYIASINIENAFHDLMQGDDYTPFDGICLTDTFQLGEGDEEDALFSDVFPKNSVRVIDQKHTPIRVIVGNPPYSVGQGSANDNAQNESYPKLEQRIASTYAAFSRAKTTKALYDSYIKAFRWASDRIDPKQGGVIGFVSNAGWLDGNAMDGFRSCLEQEFSSIYVFNLRGNQRTQGEVSRREGGKIFGSGSRTPVAITILVKNPSAQKEKADIYYVDIGDYLTREEKLKKIADFQSCMSSKFPVTAMKPNEYNDWLNQRNGLFESFIPMEPDKKHNAAAQSVFTLNTLGVNSNRDAWVYNFSKSLLEGNIKHTIMAYNESLKSYKANPADLQRRNYAKYRDMNPQNISWSSSLESQFERGNEATYEPKFLEASHRPFTSQWLYWGEKLIHRRGQMDEIFPAGEDSSNLLICVSGISGTKEMSVLITDKIPDLHFNGDTQAFPLYYYEKTDTTQGNLFDQQQTQYIRRNGITDFILGQARQLYGPKTTREDIFYYVYGFLHLPSYRKEFAADLKKSLPRILLVDEPKKFWKIAKAGRELANIHLHYESQPFPEHVVVEGEASGNFRVQKLKFAKTQGQDDRSTIIYNEDIRVADIPAKAYEYVVNGRCPIEWVMDRYQIKADNDSGIENNPNKWGEEHGNPRYILDLLLRVITVSLRTLEIVEGLPEVKFE